MTNDDDDDNQKEKLTNTLWLAVGTVSFPYQGMESTEQISPVYGPVFVSVPYFVENRSVLHVLSEPDQDGFVRVLNTKDNRLVDILWNDESLMPLADEATRWAYETLAENDSGHYTLEVFSTFTKRDEDAGDEDE